MTPSLRALPWGPNDPTHSAWSNAAAVDVPGRPGGAVRITAEYRRGHAVGHESDDGPRSIGARMAGMAEGQPRRVSKIIAVMCVAILIAPLGG